MATWTPNKFHKPVISSFSLECLGMNSRSIGSAVPATQTWPSANRALFVPLAIAAPYLCNTFWWTNGTTAAGNVDCGIYSGDGTLLAHTGSTAQSGTSVVQSVALGTPLLLLPDSYYLGLAMSSTSSTVFGNLPVAAAVQSWGMAQQASALPLPATITFASDASALLPVFGIASATVI